MSREVSGWRKRPRQEDDASDDPDAVLVGGDGVCAHKDQLIDFWRKGRFCDVTIIVEGQTFAAHRCVLAGGSDFFAKAFESMCMESAAGATLYLEEVEVGAYEAAVEFFYCAECVVSVESLLPLLRRAHFLQAAPLQRALRNSIVNRVTPASFLDAWAIAGELSLPRLRINLAEEVGSSNERIRQFSRSTEYGSLPEEAQAKIQPVAKSMLINMVRDGSAQSAKLERIRTLFQGIGYEEAGASVTIDKQARVTISWLAEPNCCGGGNHFEVGHHELRRALAAGCKICLDTCCFKPNPRAKPPGPGVYIIGCNKDAWRTAPPFIVTCMSKQKHQVTSVEVADGFPKSVRLTADGPTVQHYVLTVDVGCSFDEAQRLHAKTLRGPNSKFGWYRSNEVIAGTALHEYMLVCPNADVHQDDECDVVTPNDGFMRAARELSSIERRFTRTSEDEARDGWAAQHLYAASQCEHGPSCGAGMDNLSEPDGGRCCMKGRRLRKVHLITGSNLLGLWSELKAKGVLNVHTTSPPSTQLTGLWVSPENVPQTA